MNQPIPPFIKSLGEYQLRGDNSIAIYKGTQEVSFEKLTMQEQYEYLWFAESYVKASKSGSIIYNHYKLSYYIKIIGQKFVSYLRRTYLCSINSDNVNLKN